MADFDAVCAAGSLRLDRAQGAVGLDHRWTPGGVDLSIAFTGAHLLHAAVTACVLNDIYREAARLGVQVDEVTTRSPRSLGRCGTARSSSAGADTPAERVGGAGSPARPA